MMKQQGFTLMELILVIVLIGTVAGFAGMMLVQGTEGYMTAKRIIPVATKANVAMDNLMRELKSAENISNIDTANPTTSFTFINQQGESVQISLDGATLQRNGVALCTNVTTLTFGYFDEDFAETTTPDLIRLITLQMTITDNGIPYALTAATVIRRDV